MTMKRDLILLHGALGASKQFAKLKETLSGTFNCYTFDFLGHGSAASTTSISIELLAKQLLSFVDQHGLNRPVVFGYSMGGYVALTAESIQPNTFSKIITLGTKFAWSEEIANEEIRMINPTKIEEKVPKFANYLKELHAPTDWKVMMQQTQGLMLKLGMLPNLNESSLLSIKIPVDLNVGSLDTMVTVEETILIANQLLNSTFTKLPEIPHPIQQIEVEKLEELIRLRANN